MVCRRRTRPPSSVTWGRTEVTTLKRRVFNLFKPGEKCLRSAFFFFFVGSGTRKEKTIKNEESNFLDLFSQESFSRCGETISQVPPGCLSFWRGSSAGCEDDFEGDEYVASAGTGFSGWSEDNFDGPAHDFENSLVDGVAGNVLGDADSVVAAARHGENASGGRSLKLENSVSGCLAEPVCMNSFDGKSLNSVTCHPSMHAPSLAFEGVLHWWDGQG